MTVLHRELVAPTGAVPRAWLLLTHGIYGSGGNWRSIARKLLERRPEWGAVLVDLRGHGRSPPGDPPHTVAACAHDLAETIAELAAAGVAVRAVSGHSFGGKCVLALRARGAELAQTWVLDATPAARPDSFDAPDNTVRQVLELMERLPPRFGRRDDFVAAVIAAGQSPVLAQWLAMNLEPAPDDGGFRLRLDLTAVRALLADYTRADLWPAVEDPTLPGQLHVVIADRSTTVSPADRDRLAASSARVDVVPDAGHWLHIDAPAAVVELFARELH